MISKWKAKMQRLPNQDNKSLLLVKNIGVSLGVKGLAIIVSFINMPVFVNYFSDSVVLGLWFSILSMLNWILTFDLGIGNGLRNYLVIAMEKPDNNECRKLISSAYCSVGLAAIVLSVLSYYVVPFVDWNELCNVSMESVSRTVMIDTIRLLLVGIWIQFLLKLIHSILYAMQKPAIPNFLLLVSNVCLLLCTFLLRSDDSFVNLKRLASAYVLTANLPMAIATLVVFTTRLKGIGIRIGEWSLNCTKKILRLGSNFLILQLLSMTVFNTREFYIMRLVNPESVVPYQIYQRLFSLVSTFFILAMTPLWSAITQAVAQDDNQWIEKVYKKGMQLFGLFSSSSIVIIVFSQALVNIWLHDKAIEMDYRYSILFAVFNIEYMWISLHSQFENGVGSLQIQRIGYLVAFVLLPILAITISQTSNEWAFILVANIIALIPLCIMQPLYFRRIMRRRIVA